MIASQEPGNHTLTQEIVRGPPRVLPGRLAVNKYYILKIHFFLINQVSRTFGDAEAKLPKYGGIPNVISAEPDIMQFDLSEDNDFVLLACKKNFFFLIIKS
jgi:protein phosphatase 2C family protein 2/3